MRVAIAGAGAVGRSIARELIQNGHEVLLVDKNPSSIRPERVPNAEWLLADSCELSSLAEAQLGKCDVVIAATGDDKANLVTSLLAKTEFGVPRTVGRVNHPNNEWLFTEAWVGNRTVEFQMQSRSRIAWIDRLGEGMLPTRETVLQEGDMLHLVMREEHAAHAYAVLESGPEDD